MRQQSHQALPVKPGASAAGTRPTVATPCSLCSRTLNAIPLLIPGASQAVIMFRASVLPQSLLQQAPPTQAPIAIDWQPTNQVPPKPQHSPAQPLQHWPPQQAGAHPSNFCSGYELPPVCSIPSVVCMMPPVEHPGQRCRDPVQANFRSGNSGSAVAAATAAAEDVAAGQPSAKSTTCSVIAHICSSPGYQTAIVAYVSAAWLPQANSTL